MTSVMKTVNLLFQKIQKVNYNSNAPETPFHYPMLVSYGLLYGVQSQQCHVAVDPGHLFLHHYLQYEQRPSQRRL